MPYGFEEQRIKNGLSPNTVVHEVSLIRLFLSFVNTKYKRSVEPHEIRPVDVRDFLDSQRNTGIKDSTLSRKIIFLRTWFNYMWEIGKIPVDFMPKFKYGVKLDTRPGQIHLNYQDFLDRKGEFLFSTKSPLTTKLFYIFILRGFRLRDIVRLTVDAIQDNGDSLEVEVQTYTGKTVHILVDDPNEMAVLLMGVERAIFRDTDYLLSSKIKGRYVQFAHSSLKDHLQSLSTYFGYPVRSEEVRFAYVHYLYKKEQRTIEEIQELLGISLTNATSLLKEALERVETLDYNVKRTS